MTDGKKCRFLKCSFTDINMRAYCVLDFSFDYSWPIEPKFVLSSGKSLPTFPREFSFSLKEALQKFLTKAI